MPSNVYFGTNGVCSDVWTVLSSAKGEFDVFADMFPAATVLAMEDGVVCGDRDLPVDDGGGAGGNDEDENS